MLQNIFHENVRCNLLNLRDFFHCNINHLMKIIQRIGILFLLVVFQCGTIGISFFKYICT